MTKVGLLLQYLSISSGGSRIFHGGGRQPPMQALFGENICENERIGSHWGRGVHAGSTPLDLPMISISLKSSLTGMRLSSVHLKVVHIPLKYSMGPTLKIILCTFLMYGTTHTIQWRIKDFPSGGGADPFWGH